MTGVLCRVGGAVLCLLTVFSCPAFAQDRTMVVYLPSTPTESASRVAAAVTQLATYLSERAGVRLEAKAFRRAEDAAAYVAGSPDDVVLLVAEQPFLLDLPPAFEVLPTYRFIRSGRETRRKVVVVRTSDEATSLSGLRGRSLAVAIGGGAGSNAFLARVIFGGEIDPGRWFGRVIREPDDFTAIADVQFGRADAALVSDDNPLLQAHLGKDLREVYSSRPVSLPLLAIRSALPDAQRIAIEQALASLPGAPDHQAIVAGLNIDRLQRIPEGGATFERGGLLRLPAGTTRALEIALPSVSIDLPRAPTVPPDQVPFFLGVELLELPIPLPAIGGRGTAVSGSGHR